MRPSTTLFFAALLAALSFALPAAASEVLSFRLRQVEADLRDWLANGAQGPNPVPKIYRAAVTGLPGDGVFQAAGTEPVFALLIDTTEPEFLRTAGFEVGTIAGPIATARIPLSRLRELNSVPGVRRVDLSRQLEPLLDVSRLEVGADEVHGAASPPYPGTTGAGVVVGIIDTGIDLNHDDFWNAGGTSRVTRVWDQTDGAGPNPSGFSYGTEWSAAAINAGTTREKDLDGHGTHVAAIAAGNGRGTTGSDQYFYTGIAPEAEILVVKSNFSEIGIIEALSWLNLRAGAKSWVANLSLGAQYGPHDGTGTLDLAVASFSGPGQIIVAAGGNEGGDAVHAQFVVPASGIVQFPLLIGSYTPGGGLNNDRVYLDGWSFAGSNLSTSVITPNSTVVGPVATHPTNETATAVSTAQGYVIISQAPDPGNGDRSLLIDITDQGGVAPASGTWNVRIQNNSVSVAEEVDLWISFNDLGTGASVRWSDANQIDESELISTPASSDSVIAVAAYVTKTSWPCVQFPTTGCQYAPPPPLGIIASFSSPGPRRDGWQKPEISAPGMGITSALGADATSTLFTSPLVRHPGDVRTLSQGTSQSSPHVTGTVALLLQLQPDAAFSQITQTLALSARHDAHTGPGFSTYFGYGKLDTKEAVDLFVPVRLLSLGAAWEDGAAVLRWALAETEPGTRFVIERGPTASGPFVEVGTAAEDGLDFAWTDPSPAASEPWYRLTSLDRAGSRNLLGVVELARTATVLRLLPNAPNPFRGSTVIAFDLPRPSAVTLEILDLAGRRVTTLLSGARPEGRNQIEWNGVDDTGRRAAAGIYFYRLITSEGVFARRMVLTP